MTTDTETLRHAYAEAVAECNDLQDVIADARARGNPDEEDTIEEADLPRLAARRGGVVARAEGAVAHHVRNYRLAASSLRHSRQPRFLIAR